MRIQKKKIKFVLGVPNRYVEYSFVKFTLFIHCANFGPVKNTRLSGSGYYHFNEKLISLRDEIYESFVSMRF